MVPVIEEIVGELSKRKSSGHHDGAGCCCYFFKVSETWGAKTYHSARSRDKCFTFQQKAASHGIAPEVGSCFEFEIGEGEYREIYYGFTTEVCPYIARSVQADIRWATFVEKSREDKEHLAHIFREGFGKIWCDDHIGNWGWMDKPFGEKPVIIDFSEE